MIEVGTHSVKTRSEPIAPNDTGISQYAYLVYHLYDVFPHQAAPCRAEAASPTFGFLWQTSHAEKHVSAVEQHRANMSVWLVYRSLLATSSRVSSNP